VDRSGRAGWVLVRVCADWARPRGRSGGLELLFGNQKQIDVAVPAPAPGAGPLTIRDVLIHLKVWVVAVREHQQWCDVPGASRSAVHGRMYCAHAHT
jgi:hypothetical protein